MIRGIGSFRISIVIQSICWGDRTVVRKAFFLCAALVSICLFIAFDSESVGAQIAAPTSKDAVGEEVESGVGIEPAFHQLRFQRPVFMTHVGDERLFVVEQDGVIRVFNRGPEVSTISVFLDIRDRISRVGNEEGLLGIAFHPNFLNNGQFFVHYSSSKKDMHGVVARYRVKKDDPSIGAPDSEEIILEQKQPFRNHNGGMISFGKDGYLYVSLGDGGKANDPMGHGQNAQTLLGSVLRIDVDRRENGLEYAIPKDNPFVNRKDARGEIFALGLRNVWRFSVDRQTGDIWAGDVGQNKTEEIDIVTSGGNYGWNRFEADDVFRSETKLDETTGTHVKPVVSYGHEWGLSVTGGYVYRGKKFPELDGHYFFR